MIPLEDFFRKPDQVIVAERAEVGGGLDAGQDLGNVPGGAVAARGVGCHRFLRRRAPAARTPDHWRGMG